MSEPQRQLILAAYRPGGQDESDPAMRAALDELDAHPELKEKFERDLAFDTQFAAALESIPVPADLRDTIAAGADLSSPRRSRPASKLLRFAFPVAAAIAVMAIVAKTFAPVQPASDWEQQSIAALGTYLAPEGDSTLLGADAFQTSTWLESNLDNDIKLPSLLADRPSRMCRLIENQDGSVAVVCFDAGGGTTLHLTIYDHDSEDAPELPTSPDGSAVTRSGNWEYVAWRDERYRYLLAASISSAPCCDKLRQVARASP